MYILLLLFQDSMELGGGGGGGGGEFGCSLIFSRLSVDVSLLELFWLNLVTICFHHHDIYCNKG